MTYSKQWTGFLTSSRIKIAVPEWRTSASCSLIHPSLPTTALFPFDGPRREREDERGGRGVAVRDAYPVAAKTLLISCSATMYFKICLAFSDLYVENLVVSSILLPIALPKDIRDLTFSIGIRKNT